MSGQLLLDGEVVLLDGEQVHLDEPAPTPSGPANITIAVLSPTLPPRVALSPAGRGGPPDALTRDRHADVAVRGDPDPPTLD